MGGHTTRHNVRCSQTEVSCGFPCGKKLQCGNHLCTRICHNGPCYEELAPSKKKKKNKAKANGGGEKQDGEPVAAKDEKQISDFDRGMSSFLRSSSLSSNLSLKMERLNHCLHVGGYAWLSSAPVSIFARASVIPVNPVLLQSADKSYVTIHHLPLY